MRIGDILRPEDVIVDLRAPDKRRLIGELARLGAEGTGVEAPTVAEALQARERLGSTGMGSGMAVPHARIPTLTRTRGLFARLRPAMDFDAIDGERVDLVFLLLMPSQAQGEHLNALACVARRLRDDQVRASLRKARDREELYAVLTRTGDG